MLKYYKVGKVCRIRVLPKFIGENSPPLPQLGRIHVLLEYEDTCTVCCTRDNHPVEFSIIRY